MSTREGLRSRKLKREKVDLGDGLEIWARELSARESAQIKVGGGYATLMFALGACEEDGRRLFDPNDPADMAEIEGLGASVIIPVNEAISRLSGASGKADTAKN
jgi:hypothetical protein